MDRNVDYVEIENERIDTKMESVKKIIYHEAQFPGDAHYVDVLRTDRIDKRIFNPDCVAWSMGEDEWS